MDLSFMAIFISGLLTFLAPCVLPVYQMYISYISGMSVNEFKNTNQTQKRFVLIQRIYFVLGLSSVFMLIGFSTSLIGNFMFEYQRLLQIVGGVLLLVMGLQMMNEDQIGNVKGELTSQETDGWYTLTNTASSRIYLKQQNTTVQNKLELITEPLALFAKEVTDKYPHDMITFAWKTLLQNHPHDSICGCSIDPVHRETETLHENFFYYENTGDIGNEYIYRQSADNSFIYSTEFKADYEVLESNSLYKQIKMTQTWEIPKSADDLLTYEQISVTETRIRKATRSEEYIPYTVETIFTLR